LDDSENLLSKQSKIINKQLTGSEIDLNWVIYGRRKQFDNTVIIPRDRVVNGNIIGWLYSIPS